VEHVLLGAHMLELAGKRFQVSAGSFSGRRVYVSPSFCFLLDHHVAIGGVLARVPIKLKA